MALNKESSTDNPQHDKKKQVTATSSTLIRNLHFHPKPRVIPASTLFTPQILEMDMKNRVIIAEAHVEAVAVQSNLIPTASVNEAFEPFNTDL